MDRGEKIRTVATAWAILTSIVWACWESAWAVFNGFDRFFLALLPAGILSTGILLILLVLPGAGRCLATRRILRIGWAVGSSLFVLLSASTLVQPRDPRFEFLEGRKPAMSVDPGVPGFVGSAYTFPGDPKEVISRAARELGAQGFRTHREKGTLSASRTYPGSTMAEESIYVSSGKVIGKRWLVDGDIVESDERGDWVTVEVFRPDVLPFWLRMFLP